ncbi:MAG: glycosyltransferase family 39 protein [Candidatus Omnitrophica bacterium]|nr:glycosyltransferase family 39 protein [Candidatus Omnitrophota bacterium]
MPDRWNVDEQVAKSLRLIASRSIFTVVDTAHPQLYNIVLALFMLPYLAILKIAGYPLVIIQSAASVSWINLAAARPDFAVNIYLIGRSASVLFNLASIILLYQIAKIAYGKKEIALFSILIMSSSMGFVEMGHFAKGTSLLFLLLLSVVFFIFKSLKTDFKRNYYIAAFLAGSCVATQADGALSVFYLAAGLLMHIHDKKTGVKEVSGYLLISFLLFITGIILLWPALWVNLNKYFIGSLAAYSTSHPISLAILKEKIISNLAQLVYIFTPSIALFVFAGSVSSIFTWRSCYPYTPIFLFVLIPYFLMAIFYFTAFPGSSTKFLIHAVPALSIWGGAAIYKFIDFTGSLRIFRIAVVAVMFAFAVLYTAKGDAVFAKYDTRYSSGNWIKENIPVSASLEHFQEIDLLFPSSILKTHRVIFHGKDSRDYDGKRFYDSEDMSIMNSYINDLDPDSVKSDYIVLASGKDFLMPLSMQSSNADHNIIYRLLEGSQGNYQLVRRFEYDESVLFNPRPAYTAPVISIFKRIEER